MLAPRRPAIVEIGRHQPRDGRVSRRHQYLVIVEIALGCLCWIGHVFEMASIVLGGTEEISTGWPNMVTIEHLDRNATDVVNSYEPCGAPPPNRGGPFGATVRAARRPGQDWEQPKVPGRKLPHFAHTEAVSYRSPRSKSTGPFGPSPPYQSYFQSSINHISRVVGEMPGPEVSSRFETPWRSAETVPPKMPTGHQPGKVRLIGPKRWRWGRRRLLQAGQRHSRTGRSPGTGETCCCCPPNGVPIRCASSRTSAGRSAFASIPARSGIPQRPALQDRQAPRILVNFDPYLILDMLGDPGSSPFPYEGRGDLRNHWDSSWWTIQPI